MIERQGKSRIEEGLREMGKRIGKKYENTFREFSYKEEQRRVLMADRRCAVKERFFFSFCRRKRM